VDPLTTALGFVHVQIEYALSNHVSVYAGPSLHLFGGLLAAPDDLDFIGIGAEAGVRYYFNGTAPAGWWGLARSVLASLSTTSGPALSSLGGYVSVLGGYTWIWDDRWVASLGAGVQYLDYQVGGAGPRGFLPAAHTTIGVAF